MSLFSLSTRQPKSPTPASRQGALRALLVGCLGVALVVGSMVAFNTALGDIAQATAASQTALTWIVDGYSVALACLLLPAGSIGDRYGRRAALLGGLAVFAVASAAPAIFANPAAIVVCRIVAGYGAAFVMPATLALIAQSRPRTQRGNAVGIWAGVAGCGGIAGMAGSALLLQFSDWRSVSWALAAAAAVVAAVGCTVTPSRDADAPPVDWAGAVLIAAAIALLVTALLDAPHRGWSDVATVLRLAASAALGWIFVVAEGRRVAPLIDMRLFRDPRFAAATATITVVFAATFGFFYLGMQYVQLIMGYSALTSALAFTPFVVPVVTLSALSSRHASHLTLRPLLFIGLTLVAAAFVSMLALDTHPAYPRVALIVVTIGAGIGLCTAPATSSIMAAVADERQGVGSAMNDAAREIGAALGIALTGSVLAQRYSGAIAPTLASLPEFLRRPFSESLGEALPVARQLGPQGYQTAEHARGAFVAGMHAAAAVMAMVVIAVAVFIAFHAPGREDQPRGRSIHLLRKQLWPREIGRN